MNNYNCEIVADSVNTSSDRITTFKLTYPRIVHAELMTHRMFSRNAASSRAVPIKKMIESIKNNMFTPLAIQKAHKGMQGSDYFKGQELEEAKKLWIESAELALEQAEKMKNLGITKQLINRILEPYQYYQVLVTATEWENFFKLRCPNYSWQEEGNFRSWENLVESHFNNGASRDWIEGLENTPTLKRLENNRSQADIHIQAIAELMWDAYNESEPKELKAGEWHIPFGDNIKEEDILPFIGKFEVQSVTHQKEARDFIKRKIAVARCARISYQTLGDDPKIDYKADIRLHDMLAGMEHWSPFEHVAKVMSVEEYYEFQSGKLIPVDTLSNEGEETTLLTSNTNTDGWCRNFRGFIQYRSLFDKS